jgi:hypothetical protein
VHLRNAYRRLQVRVPDELFVTNISTTAAPAVQAEPTGVIAPTLDGEETSYFEWLGAGVLEVRETAGAMHQVDRRPAAVTLVHFGCGGERLWIRVDVGGRAIDLVAGGRELSLKFVRPAGVRFSVRLTAGLVIGTLWDRRDSEPHWVERGPGGAAIAVGTILELSIPYADLGLSPGETASFFVAVYDGGGAELERHPWDRTVEFRLADALFEARQWRV